MSTVTIRFDGACTNNGRSNAQGSFGWVVISEGRVIGHGRGYCTGSKHTNNVAEYQALIAALQWVYESGMCPEKLLMEGDSKLVVKTVSGSWRVKKPHLRELRDEIRDLLRRLKCRWGIKWIPRSANWQCDELSKTPEFGNGH
jgi:ribonuclease HI